MRDAHRPMLCARTMLCTAVVVATTALAAQEPVVTNSIGMELLLIQPGTMTVGRFQPPYPKPPGTAYTAEEYARIEQAAKADTTPGFKVGIEHPYYIGKYEVTQAAWTRVMRTNPSTFQGDKVTDAAERHPVDNVTWADAQAFVRKLNSLEKTPTY